MNTTTKYSTTLTIFFVTLLLLTIGAAPFTADSTTTAAEAGRQQTALPSNPIMFVTQVPVPTDFNTVGSTFGNHRPSLRAVARGGDLWIRYPEPVFPCRFGNKTIFYIVTLLVGSL